MCYRVEVEANCGCGVQRQKLARLLSLMGPGAVDVRSTADGWSAMVRLHAASAESAQSMALTRLATASSHAQLPTPLALTCTATPDVDRRVAPRRPVSHQ